MSSLPQRLGLRAGLGQLDLRAGLVPQVVVETNNKQEGFQGKGKGEAVEKGRRASSKGVGTAGKARRGEGVGGAGGGGGVVKKVIAKCPHNRRRSTGKPCGRASILRALPHKKRVQAMQRGEHLRDQPH